jgi:hypothetical protein
MPALPPFMAPALPPLAPPALEPAPPLTVPPLPPPLTPELSPLIPKLPATPGAPAPLDGAPPLAAPALELAAPALELTAPALELDAPALGALLLFVPGAEHAPSAARSTATPKTARSELRNLRRVGHVLLLPIFVIVLPYRDGWYRFDPLTQFDPIWRHQPLPGLNAHRARGHREAVLRRTPYCPGAPGAGSSSCAAFACRISDMESFLHVGACHVLWNLPVRDRSGHQRLGLRRCHHPCPGSLDRRCHARAAWGWRRGCGEGHETAGPSGIEQPGESI